MSQLTVEELFAARLHQAAGKFGIERAHIFGKFVGLHPGTAYTYWKGTRRASLETCFYIAEKLQCDPHWLRGDCIEPAATKQIRPPSTPASEARRLTVTNDALQRISAALFEIADALEEVYA